MGESLKVQCPNCGKTDRVNIGQKVYCASCGVAIDDAQTSQAAAPATPAAASAAPPAGTTVNPATPPAAPPVQPAATKPEAAPMPAAQPASQLHARPQTSPNVINLKAMPQPKTPETAAQAVLAVPNLGTKHEARQARAAAVTKSSSIKKFGSQKPNQPSTPPTAVSAPTPPPTPPPTPAAVAPPAQPAPTPAPPALPNQVATQVEANQKLVAAEPPRPLIAPSKPAHSRPPKPIMVGIAAVLLLLGGSLIWWQNYPRMAVKLAAQRAGIEASLPGYLPSSFNLSGPIAYGAGQVILNYRSANQAELKITQQRTDWDNNALLDNFVAQTSSDYLAVQGQGLTVYIYGGNKATWVNHGIWYQIDGSSKLNREQVLKIAYSL